MAESNIPIVIAKGDGIGPEIMEAVLHILKASGAPLEIEEVEIGETVYLRGFPAGIEDSTWDKIRNSKAFLKAPITTPQGGGFKSLNVTVRGNLGLYANIRPCISYAPYIKSKHPGMDVVVVRENEEDLYAGIEYRQTQDSTQALKIISRSSSEKIIRYAFEYAKAYNRKKVTCFTKDNILKITDGLFHEVFDEIAKEYPSIENEHWIVDIGSAKLADGPEVFDVLVLPNLYGDILSDVAAQVAGSVGLAGSANIGIGGAMFEAIHGSAPRRAGKNLANPSGLLQAAIQMLVHIGLPDHAANIQNAWLKTLEEGIHTYDIYEEGKSKEKVGTKEFGEAVAKRLGQTPNHFKKASYNHSVPVIQERPVNQTKKQKKHLVGIDVFIESTEEVEPFRKQLQSIETSALKLTAIHNRGVKVWPKGSTESHLIDQWRCRYEHSEETPIQLQDTIELLKKGAEAKLEIIQTQNLYTFDGKTEFSLSQDKQ